LTKEQRRLFLIKPSILILSLVSIVFVLTCCLTINTVARANILQQALSMEKLQLGQIDLVAQRLTILQKQWRQQELTADTIMAKVPTGENLPNLLSELSGLADRCNVIVSNLTLASSSELEQGGSGRQIAIDLAVKGPYDKMKEYLSLLLTTERYLVIEEMDLVQAQSYTTDAIDDGTNFWTAHINLIAFFLPPFTESGDKTINYDVIDVINNDGL
jgi:Tfp pilus assembly protein PilO